jgi:hypothetical protein
MIILIFVLFNRKGEIAMLLTICKLLKKCNNKLKGVINAKKA